MKIVTIGRDEEKPRKYVPLTEAKVKDIVKSKVLVIKNLSVTITQNFDEDVDFVIKTDPGMLSDNKTIPELDICAKEDVVFDEDITKAKLESIIRRCGILDKYAEYFIKDPDIIIDSYTLTIKKNYRYFNEFKEGILIGGDIFM
jgi:hypothetical protein